MPEGNRVRGEPHLQRPHQRARGVFHEMREPVVRHRLAPVAQDRLRGRRRTLHGTAT